MTHEARTNIMSFVRWQLQRGKASFYFKKKVVRVDSFVKTRLWSIKNVLKFNITDIKIFLIVPFIIVSIIMQIIGYCIASRKMQE